MVSSAVNKSVAVAARFARRALEPIATEADGKAEAAPQNQNMKGWRKHMRRVKARERNARG